MTRPAVVPTAAPPPLTFDRTTGRLGGANAIEHAAKLAMQLGAKATAPFHYRGLSLGCRVLQRALAEREIVVRLADDSVFAFPYGDPYWTRLFNRSMTYEPEVDHLLRAIADVDYAFVDCGANFGFWSVLVTSRAYGSHDALAIEPSGRNAARLRENARRNGDRFTILNCAIGEADGTAWLSGNKHEGMTIAGPSGGGGEQVEVVSLDGLIRRGLVSPDRRVVVKLDVEGVEVEAMKGGRRLLAADAIVICEDHGLDPTHRVSRYLLGQSSWVVFGYDTKTGVLARLTDIETLARLKAAAALGYNVFAATSAFWADRLEKAGTAARH
jgi:FkbM family methyltransferase